MAKKHLSAVYASCQNQADWQWFKIIRAICGWDGENTDWKYICNCTDLPWTDLALCVKWRAVYISRKCFIVNMQSSDYYISNLFNVVDYILEFVVGHLMHMNCLEYYHLCLEMFDLKYYIFQCAGKSQSRAPP